jgi:hypothetical protein
MEVSGRVGGEKCDGACCSRYRTCEQHSYLYLIYPTKSTPARAVHENTVAMGLVVIFLDLDAQPWVRARN